MIDDTEDYVDTAKDAVLCRWGSMAAPFLPTVLLSKQSSTLLFSTPWRAKGCAVLQLRSAVLHLAQIVEDDSACLLRWLLVLTRFVVGSFWLSPAEILCALYSVTLLVTSLAGLTSLSAALGVGVLVQRAYLLVWAQGCASLAANALCLWENGAGPGCVVLLRQKLRSFAFTTLATALLPKDVLAVHILACVVFGLLERTVLLLKGLVGRATRSAAAARMRCLRDSEPVSAERVLKETASDDF
jgi:hypothetical protein